MNYDKEGNPAGHPQPGVGGAYPPPPAYNPSSGAAYPPAPVYNPQPGQPVTFAPVVTPVIVTSVFHDTPASTTCPACRQNVITNIHYSTGLLVWLLFGILLIFGCWLGCCLIPFCVDSCKDVDHFCPNCNHHLYKYKRM
ncbi:LITAF domain-containing protein [Xenopus laevis]|uniref:LITAF domain-containing protein n=2 Tax=Xenopus laevis TaxID=8355 RepID=A0A1L8EXF7_XENLA|nr:LITAF domain-containing protein [Xenopus laevis]OCT64021.1 hypothetical protein XELAEV_18045121mg [Xenopus laevis]